MKHIKQILAVLVAGAMVTSAAFTVCAENDYANKTAENEKSVSSDSSNDYSNYLKLADGVSYGSKLKLDISAVSAKSDNAQILQDICNTAKNGIVIPDDGFVTWHFSVPQKCTYILNTEYISPTAASGNLEFRLKIDGKVPFSEASVISLSRTYIQEQKFSENKNENDLKPEVYEESVWKTKDLSDSSGYLQKPFTFVFEQGEHTITFEGSRGEIAFNTVTLKPYDEPIPYEEYLNSNKNKNNNSKNNGEIVIEGERFIEKSAVTVVPATDRSSAATYPQSAVALKLNTVGGSSWKNPGESITWEINVENDGFYKIAPRFLQETKDGIFTCRKLTIDGEVPFSEATSLCFDFNSSWQCKSLCDVNGKEFDFYLEKGTHKITLEAVAGDVADIVSTVSDSLNDLNRIYRRIVLITGTSPDVNRDYNFANIIPNEIEEMKAIKDDLQAQVDNINKLAGANGSFVSIIQKIIFQLDKMTSNPRTIAKYFSRFKSNLGSLGEWLLTATQQPLEIDRIYVLPSDSKVPKAKSGFFKNLWFSVCCFAASYSTDYTSIGKYENADTEKEINVWVQTGRDQGEVIRELVDSSFSKDYGIPVKLQIVSTGLLQSVLSGNSPDVVMDCTETLPMDYALRNAVVDLTQFSDYEEVAKRFSKASLRPVEFGGAVYGMPQTFDFMMMFYRTDIFNEYGYKVPKTWQDLADLIPSMQRNSLEVGLPHDHNIYAAMLYQSGGELYKSDGAFTNLDSNTALSSFADFTEFFTLYDCPFTFNFANRFRSGEMPIAIAALSQYNQLTAFAPEIKGMWEMVPIPGKVDENGNVNNTSTGAGTYIVMMRSCKNRDSAWEFMKWFTSNNIQSKYAVKMESILGTCAKVASANVEALTNMTWSSSEYKQLIAQLDKTDSIPQVPGGYYLSRIISFAFNRVYNNDENPSETMMDYIKELNEEIARKREEFGLGGETE